MSYLKGRVVLVTGAAGGFGRIIACEAAKRGAKIVACDINAEELNNTVASIEQENGKAVAVTANVIKADDMSAAVETAVETFERIDILINNAGTMPIAFFSDHAAAIDAWHRCIDINFKGALNGIAAAYDQMIAQGCGHVVNISSIYSNIPVKGAAVYGATKAALNYLSESLRLEAHGKIKVTTVRPTGVPATGLKDSVINVEASMGCLGVNAGEVVQRMQMAAEGNAKAEWLDSDNIEYNVLSPEQLVEQVLYAIDQPWGVSISDITVRASGDMFVM